MIIYNGLMITIIVAVYQIIDAVIVIIELMITYIEAMYQIMRVKHIRMSGVSIHSASD